MGWVWDVSEPGPRETFLCCLIFSLLALATQPLWNKEHSSEIYWYGICFKIMRPYLAMASSVPYLVMWLSHFHHSLFYQFNQFLWGHWAHSLMLIELGRQWPWRYFSQTVWWNQAFELHKIELVLSLYYSEVSVLPFLFSCKTLLQFSSPWGWSFLTKMLFLKCTSLVYKV